MANTSRPCSAAARAVMSEPEASAASTTRQPRARPLIRRLRRGKLCASGPLPSANSDSSRPRSAICCRERRVAPRVDDVDAGAEHRDGRAGARPARRDARRRRCRARVPRRWSARRRSAPGRSSRRCVSPCAVALRLPTIAKRRALQQLDAAARIKQRRRIGDLEQRSADSVSSASVITCVAGLLEPTASACATAPRTASESQCVERRRRSERGELGALARENLMRQAELLEQAAKCGGAEPGCERELQPARQPGVLRHAGGEAREKRSRGRNARASAPHPEG